jgi:hypothetical protein
MGNSTTTTVTGSGQTGGTCQTSGPYMCARHTNIVVFFKRGDKFSADPVDGRSTGWSIVSAT